MGDIVSARVRIGAVRLKSGGEVRLLRQSIDKAQASLLAAFREAVASCDGATSFAAVLWDDRGGSLSTWFFGKGNPIPLTLLPEFARTRLLLAIAGKWALEDVNAAWGHPPSDPAS